MAAKPKSAKSVIKPVASKQKPVSAAKTPAKPDATSQKPADTSTRPGWQQRLAPYVRRIGRIIAITSLPEVFLISSFCMARYLKNSDFSYPSEIVLNIVLLSVIATVFFYVFRVVLGKKRLLAIHIAGLLLAYKLYAYDRAYPTLHGWLNHLVPNGSSFFTEAMIVIVSSAVIFGAVGFVIDYAFKHIKQLRNVPVFKILLFVICFVFASQLVKVGLRMWEIRDSLAYQYQAADLQQDKGDIQAKPNIYYLLFDRYADAKTLKNVYGFDNSSFLNFLDQQGFVTREEAYANYPFTMMSASSTLAMQYHSDIGQQFKDEARGFQAAFAYRSILDHPPVVQELKDNGYTYNHVSSWWDFTRKIPEANNSPSESFRLRLFGKNFWISDLQRDIINKSVLSPLLLKGLAIGDTTIVQYQLDRNPQQNFFAQMDAVKDIAASGQQGAPHFTFAHVLSPHDPYIFDKSGQTPSYDQNRTDWDIDEHVKYTNQLTYVNTQIKQLISTIRQNDPSAVIVMQTDEGPYPKQFRGKLTSEHYYDPINLPVENMRQKFGILASYYLPGVSETTETSPITSSVNAFRYVLDHYLGYELSMLPDCHFSTGNKFHLYNYQLVSARLTGEPAPAECKQYR